MMGVFLSETQCAFCALRFKLPRLVSVRINAVCNGQACFRWEQFWVKSWAHNDSHDLQTPRHQAHERKTFLHKDAWTTSSATVKIEDNLLHKEAGFKPHNAPERRVDHRG